MKPYLFVLPRFLIESPFVATLLLVAVLSVGGCDHYSHQLNAMSPAAGTSHDVIAAAPESYSRTAGYADRLAEEYHKLARYENDVMFDYKAAKFYTEKAAAAARGGRKVLPSRPDQYEISPAALPELEKARQDLLAALQEKFIPENYEGLAKAQAKYDSWLEQQEESHQGDEIISCKFAFYEALMNLADPLPDDQYAAVFFAHDSAAMNEQNRVVLRQVATFMHDYPQFSVILTGYTDRRGSTEYNERLSRQRVQAVRDALVTYGVDRHNISMQGRGERSLPVVTADEAPSASNRRVEILLKRPPSGSFM